MSIFDDLTKSDSEAAFLAALAIGDYTPHLSRSEWAFANAADFVVEWDYDAKPVASIRFRLVRDRNEVFIGNFDIDEDHRGNGILPHTSGVFSEFFRKCDYTLLHAFATSVDSRNTFLKIGLTEDPNTPFHVVANIASPNRMDEQAVWRMGQTTEPDWHHWLVTELEDD